MFQVSLCGQARARPCSLGAGPPVLDNDREHLSACQVECLHSGLALGRETGSLGHIVFLIALKREKKIPERHIFLSTDLAPHATSESRSTSLVA